jgi:hypothetical protein
LSGQVGGNHKTWGNAVENINKCKVRKTECKKCKREDQGKTDLRQKGGFATEQDKRDKRKVVKKDKLQAKNCNQVNFDVKKIANDAY